MTPKKIALLTDLQCRLRVGIRPGKQYLCPAADPVRGRRISDGVTSPADIYQRFANGSRPDSLPRVEDFQREAPGDLLIWGYDGDVMLSSGLSGTHNLARIVSGGMQCPGYQMKVFD